MKVLVTGGKGQLGIDVTEVLRNNGHEVYSYSREELDITNNNQVQTTIAEILPDVVVHTAAYTKVDLAEQEVDAAYKVNAIGTRNVAVAAEKAGAKLIYISTDYVFNGQANLPYNEYNSTSPQSIYGKSKLAGEQFVEQLSSRFFILRTSWVYGKHGNNFVKTMLKLAEERSELSVVYDQVGSPTYTVDLANFINEILDTELFGTYHVSNSGHCSWYEFAREIFLAADLPHVKVNPVTTAEFPRPAPRPAYSVLDHMAIRLNGLGDLPTWQNALRNFIKDFNLD